MDDSAAAESPFGPEELFYSTTDRRGIITAGNDVFVRVSGYAADELVGRPHNVIRHPHMPRAVFRLLWSYLGAGRPVAAYVKNRAADGRHYWVMASVVPLGDGYLSVRLKPSSELFGPVRELYAEMRALELRLGGEGERRRDEAMEASAALMAERLPALGFADYDALMHVALPEEVACRRRALDDGRVPRPAAPVAPDRRLREILASCGRLEADLDGLVRDLDGYLRLSDALSGKSSFVLRLAEEIRLLSLNAMIAARRLEGGGAALGTTADILRARSDAAAVGIQTLTGGIDASSELLHDLAFRICAARLQVEMATVFTGEVAGGDGAHDLQEAGRRIAALGRCAREGIARVHQSLSGLDAALGAVAGGVARLDDDLRVMRALEVVGRMEGARIGEEGAFAHIFRAIRDQVEAAEGELAGLGGATTARRQDGRTTAAIDLDLTRVERTAAAMAEGSRAA